MLRMRKVSSLLASHWIFHPAVGNWVVQALLQLQCRAEFNSHLLPWKHNIVELMRSAQGGILCSSQEKAPWACVICPL